MPYPCNPCDCPEAYYRDSQSWRKAVIELLCDLSAIEDTINTNLVAVSKSEDDAHVSGDKGIMALSRRIDTLASSAGTSGDYATINTDAYGRVYVNQGDVITISVDLTVTTTQYSSGEALGTGISFADAVRTGVGTGRIREVVVSDASAQGVNLELVCTTAASPTASVDNAAFDPTDTDIKSFIRPIPIFNHFAYNDNGVSTSGDINVPFGPLSNTTLKAFLIARGAPTYAAGTDVRVSITIERD